MTDGRTAPGVDHDHAEQIESFIGVPIFHQGQWRATLSVKGYGERHWRQDEIDLLETVAGQLAALLEKVRAEEAVRQLNSTLETRVQERTAALEQANRELMIANRELEQFSYAAAHDLRSPLRGIANLVQWLQDDAMPVLPPPSQKHLALLQGRVKRLEQMLEDILAYSRIVPRPLCDREGRYTPDGA
ncbi:MAG: histidine kinase dimerization/phospho-acceptor domain-containing protein [Caldilineaceae bacterium]